MQKHQYRELDIPDNPGAVPPSSHTKSTLILFGKYAWHTLTVCVEPHCPVPNPREAACAAADPPPVMASAAQQETEEEAAQREAEHGERMAQHQVEQERKEEQRKAEFERQQKEYEAEQEPRDKQRKARLATFRPHPLTGSRRVHRDATSFVPTMGGLHRPLVTPRKIR